MAINVRREIYAEPLDQKTAVNAFHQYFTGTGPERVEYRALAQESDFENHLRRRFSKDNGRTWGKWEDVSDFYESNGKDEINLYYGAEIYNKVHGHFVSLGMRRVYEDGHIEAYKKYWGTGEMTFYDHCLVVVRKDGSDNRDFKLVKYEQGADFDNTNWTNPEYVNHNRAYFGCNVDVFENGDIIFAMTVDGEKCLKILDMDPTKIFNAQKIKYGGMIVGKGKFNEATGNYDLTFSRTVVISELKSSRGIGEPTVAILPTGRILIVFRGSNVIHKGWNPKIEKGTPAHKWYCYSDDGGQTFTDPMPWHYDNQEIFYSSASISRLFKSEKNNQIYWIGNITDHTAYGNYPRHPLIIAQVNDAGLLMKDTYTIIDKKEEGDSDKMQLSNFYIIQDRETGNIELFLIKHEQKEGYVYWADCVRYFIEVPDPD